MLASDKEESNSTTKQQQQLPILNNPLPAPFSAFPFSAPQITMDFATHPFQAPQQPYIMNPMLPDPFAADHLTFSPPTQTLDTFAPAVALDKPVKFQLAICVIMQEFGDNGLFYFRDAAEITHWKNVANIQVWDFCLYEWIFALKGRGKINADTEFTPCSSWDFLGKPYVPQGTHIELKPRLSQGSRFLRRDLRCWIKSGKTSGILKKLHAGAVDVGVIMSLKYMLAFEQSVGNVGFPAKELSTLPAKGSDMQLEAERRMLMIKSCYNQNEEARLGSVAYWKTVDIVQSMRRGASSGEKPGEKRKSKAKGLSSDASEDEEFAAKRKKARMSEPTTEVSKYATEIGVPESMMCESQTALNAAFTIAIEKEDLAVNVVARSGKSIAKDMKVSSLITFAALLEKLPLPQIPGDEIFICLVDGGKVFEGGDVLGDGVGKDDVIVVKRGRKVIVEKKVEMEVAEVEIETPEEVSEEDDEEMQE